MISSTVANQNKIPGVLISEIKDYIKPAVWETLNTYKDYKYVESITFINGIDDDGQLLKLVSFQYLRGTIGTKFKESHLAVDYDLLMKTLLKSSRVQAMNPITEEQLFNHYCSYGDLKDRNPVAQRIVGMEVDLTGKNLIKIEVGVPRSRGNRVVQVINATHL
jgi:hypothetical protein